MTTLHWQTVRDDAIQKFNGQTPRAEDEETILRHFVIRPMVVANAIDETAETLAAGKIKYAWSILASRLERGTTPTSDVTVDTGKERGKKIANAETWTRQTGAHYDQAHDVEDELFGERGTLKAYADDETLRARLLKLWRERRDLHQHNDWLERAGPDFRRVQWQRARQQQERWATHNDNWDDYEEARKMGQRPFWKPGSAAWWTRQKAEA